MSDLETSRMRRPRPTLSCCATHTKIKIKIYDGFLWRDLNVKRVLLREVPWNIARFILERLPKHKTGILQENLLTKPKKKSPTKIRIKYLQHTN